MYLFRFKLMASKVYHDIYKVLYYVRSDTRTNHCNGKFPFIIQTYSKIRMKIYRRTCVQIHTHDINLAIAYKNKFQPYVFNVPSVTLTPCVNPCLQAKQIFYCSLKRNSYKFLGELPRGTSDFCVRNTAHLITLYPVNEVLTCNVYAGPSDPFEELTHYTNGFIWGKPSQLTYF